jgi:hypothetical protein
MTEAPRLGAVEARAHQRTGALIACAYEDSAKCQSLRLDGALTHQELEARLPKLSKEQEIIFYCA